MITRIELTNFMSHKHTVIEPAAGLTVLVGPNNIGKSAVVAALQILCHNEASTHVIRHGERECLIHVETDDGHTIEWRRKTSPSYLIDGQQFDRLGKGNVPDELHKALRLSKADSGADADFDIHFGTQKAPIFLLASTPANAAKFFASSSDAIRLVEIQKRHKDNLADAQREKRGLEAESRQVNAELADLEPVIEVDDRLTALEEVYDQLLAAATWLEAAEKHAQALAEKTAAVQQQRRLSNAFTGLKPPPQLQPTEPLAALIFALESAERKRTVAKWRAAELQSLPSPPTMHDIGRLESLLESITAASNSVARSKAEHSALTPLVAPPELADTETLARQIDRLATADLTLRNARQSQSALAPLVAPPLLADTAPLASLLAAYAQATVEVERWQAQHAALGPVSPPPIAIPTSELEAFLERLARAQANVDALSAELATTTAEWTAAGDALRAAAAGALCPACGAELDPERVVARAAAGLGGHDHD